MSPVDYIPLVTSDVPWRVQPKLNDDNRSFWTSGATGALRIHRCGNCRYWIHPPSPACPVCRSREVAPEPVTGLATVLTHTVNHQLWDAASPEPYSIAIVTLDEQEDLRLTTNIVGCEPSEVVHGMRVHVVFENHGEIYVPLFAPGGSDDV